MTIGKELQKQRRAKQLSLEAVSQTLRVDQATLQKIEADDFQGLNPVLVRSCIRQYASLLGLDGAKLLDQFTEPAAAGKDAPQAAKPVQPVQPAKKPAAAVRADKPAASQQDSAANKAKEILNKSKLPHGFKAIFKFFDAINLDKLMKLGIWVILGLAAVGSVAGGFSALASKASSDQSSSSSSSASSSSKSAPAASSKPADQKPDQKDNNSQPDKQSQSSQQQSSQSSSREQSQSSSSSQAASSSSSAASSSSQEEQSSQSASQSSQSSTDTTTTDTTD